MRAVTTVIALAGRRVDAADAPHPRFPSSRADAVRQRLGAVLVEHAAVALVASAACGVDLLGHEAAAPLGLRRIVVLPFAPARFRELSVTDRPDGETRWGPAFDRLLREVPRADLRVLDLAEGSAAYDAASVRILDEAEQLAASLGATTLAVVAWDGVATGPTDHTAAFAAEARRRGVRVEEVATR